MNFDEYQGLARSLFEEAGDALFLCDPEIHQILDANCAAQRLTGFLLRDLLRLPVPQLFRSSSSGGMQELLRNFHSSECFRSRTGYAVRSVQTDLWVPVLVTVSRLHVQPRMLVLLTARSPNEQVPTSAEPENREKEWRRMLASGFHCSWSGEVGANQQLVYHWFSPAVEWVTGQPAGFFLAGTNRWWNLVHKEDQPTWERFMTQVLAGESGDHEYRLVRPDGSTQWVRETISIFAEEGKPTCLHGTVAEVLNHTPESPSHSKGKSISSP
jgi:PAS domain-containing protein